MLAGVIFDLDGVLIDSEECRDEAHRGMVAERGGRWTAGATRAMMDMSAPEWSRYLRDELGVDVDPGAINRAVVRRMAAAYRERLPLLPGPAEAVRALEARWMLGLASSSNRKLITLVLERTSLVEAFSAVVSAEALSCRPRRWRAASPRRTCSWRPRRASRWAPGECVAVEDSSDGLRSPPAAPWRWSRCPTQPFRRRQTGSRWPARA